MKKHLLLPLFLLLFAAGLKAQTEVKLNPVALLFVGIGAGVEYGFNPDFGVELNTLIVEGGGAVWVAGKYYRARASTVFTSVPMLVAPLNSMVPVSAFWWVPRRYLVITKYSLKWASAPAEPLVEISCPTAGFPSVIALAKGTKP